MFKLTPEKLVIILFNVVPVIGVAYYNWAPFEMFWLFWMETLIIAFFNSIRILYSQGWSEQNIKQEKEVQLNYGAALKYLIVRIGIFLFYSIFIIVFIGVLGSRNAQSMTSLGVIVFANKLFNLALLLMICSQSFYLVKYFFMNKAYYFSQRQQYSALFDGRQIVIHIAVVIGGVGMAFLFENPDNNWGAIWIISIFCVVKCIFELYFAQSLKSVGSFSSQ